MDIQIAWEVTYFGGAWACSQAVGIQGFSRPPKRKHCYPSGTKQPRIWAQQKSQNTVFIFGARSCSSTNGPAFTSISLEFTSFVKIDYRMGFLKRNWSGWQNFRGDTGTKDKSFEARRRARGEGGEQRGRQRAGGGHATGWHGWGRDSGTGMSWWWRACWGISFYSCFCVKMLDDAIERQQVFRSKI